jgi:hypothetical protein
VIVGVSIDSLPDPPALSSHSNDAQVILALVNHGPALQQALPLDWRMGSSFVDFSWVPIRQLLDLKGPRYPLNVAFHFSDSSPPTVSQI